MISLYRIYVYVVFSINTIIELIRNILRCTPFRAKRCKSLSNASKKVVIVTGANTGIGKETSRLLAKHGAKVIMACRNIDKGIVAAKEIREKHPNAELIIMKLDLSSLASVRQFAKEVSSQESHIDILINNAGIMDPIQSKTRDGFEAHMGTNYLGHFLLTLLLVDQLKNARNARIVNVSALLHQIGEINFDNFMLENNWAPIKAYANSKLAQILFTRELAHRLSSTNIKAYSLHPGIIRSELTRTMVTSSLVRLINNLLLIDCVLGSQTTLYCALDESIQNESGFYYNNCRRVKCMLSHATDDDVASKLWDLSCDLVKAEQRIRLI